MGFHLQSASPSQAPSFIKVWAPQPAAWGTSLAAALSRALLLLEEDKLGLLTLLGAAEGELFTRLSTCVSGKTAFSDDKLSLPPVFFSLLPPFNPPSLWSGALRPNVKGDGLCGEVRPDLRNVATFSLLARELPAA